MENYEKKYKDLEGKIKKAYLYAQADSTKAVLEDILPELAESEEGSKLISVSIVVKDGNSGEIRVYNSNEYGDIETYNENQV